MKKIYRIIAIVLFLSALFLTPLCLFLSEDEDFSENENRYLAGKPKFSLDAVFSGEFMENTEKYMDDQFPFRDFWTRTKADILKLTGNKEVNGVYLGADDYLMEKWLDSEFDETQLQQNIEAVNSFVSCYPNLKTSVMIVPTAGLVLKDKLPANAPMFDQTRAFDQMKSSLDGADYIDLNDTLIAHKEENVFYKTDHHWTTYGAFLAYEKWCEISGTTVSAEDFMVESVTDSFKGSMYSKVLRSNCVEDEIELYQRKRETPYQVSYNFGKTKSDSVYALENLNKKDKYQVFLNGNHPELSIQTDLSNGRHLLMFKDSYANAFIPFLINDYESIHVIDPRYFNGDLDSYILENEINECLFLYNIKNFCEDKNLEKAIGSIQ